MLLEIQQHLSSILLTKSICGRCLKILQHLSNSNLLILVLDNHLEKLISLSATRSIKHADVGSLCWKNLGSLIEMPREVICVRYASSISCLSAIAAWTFSSLIENLRPCIVFL